jgi:hypothetical protein
MPNTTTIEKRPLTSALLHLSDVTELLEFLRGLGTPAAAQWIETLLRRSSADEDPDRVRAYQENVKTKYGDVECDPNAAVSMAAGNPDSGAYVQCWRWVYDTDAGLPSTDTDEK